jgi:uncharacterized protein involved in exopolysaccharide biosynthesis
MSVQIEQQGQLQEFLGILLRRKWQVLLPAFVVMALGVAAAVIVPKKFVAKTQIELRPVGVSISNKEGGNAPFQIRSKNRIKKVVQELQHREYLVLPPDEQNEFIDDVQTAVKVTPATSGTQGATFVNIEYADVEQEWALKFLRALRTDWIEDVLNRDIKKVEAEQQTLLEERNKQEKELHREEELLADLRSKNNLSATQPVPGSDATRNEDPDYTRLKLNESLRDKAVNDLATIAIKIKALQARYDEMPPKLTQANVVPGISNEAALGQIQLDIAATERELAGIKSANSKFKIAQEKLRGLTEQRDQLSRLVTKGELQETYRDNPDLAPLRKEIEALELEQTTLQASLARLKTDITNDQTRVDELQPVYREVRERMAKIDRLQAALTVTEGDYQKKVRQVLDITGPLANPFEITEEVHTTLKPTEPNPLLILSFAVVAGLALGLTLAVVSEYSKSCFRSVGDISRVMVVPVLGTINTIVTRRQRRLSATKRILVGVSSLVFIGTILFVTWAWATNAQLLSADVRDTIEHLRSKFR